MLALVSAGGSTAAIAASTGGPSLGLSQLLPGTVSRLLSAFERLGPLQGSRQITLTLPLALPDRAALNQFVTGLYTPGSPSFRKFLTPSQFGQRFGAATSEISAATAALERLGLNVLPAGPNHLYLRATAPVATIEHVFSTTLERLGLAGHALLSGQDYFANTSAIRLPATLSGLITSVIGLDDFARPEPSLSTAPSAATAAGAPRVKPYIGGTKGVDGGASACLAAVAGVGFTAPDLAQAYDFNGLYARGLHGEGMSAALVEYGDYHDSNLQTMESCYGVTTPVTRRPVDGGSGGFPSSTEIEVMSDISVLLEMAPKLAHLYVYEAPISGLGAPTNDGGAEIDLYNAFVTDDLAPVLSSSWGNCEQLQGLGYDELLGAIAEEAAAQGQAIFDAAGDSGAAGCLDYPPPIGGSISIEQESGIPWVTSVGGTDLSEGSTLTGTTTHHEDTWNDAGAGGGGQSTIWSMPAWQQAYFAATHIAPAGEADDCGAPAGTFCRMVPDVAMNADQDAGGLLEQDRIPPQFFPTDVGSPGYSIYCGTSNCSLGASLLPINPTLPGGLLGWEPVGGTSLATPLFTAAALLWDQWARQDGLAGLGFLNPSLYAIASNPAKYAADFHDITTDSNSGQYGVTNCPPGCNPNHLYAAGAGYDMATGLGSVDAAKLGADLVGQASTVVATPSLERMYGYLGGPTTTQTVSITGGGRSSFTAKSSAAWLKVTPSGRAPGTLVWHVDPTRLKARSYTGRITIHGKDGGTTTVTVAYSVTPPAKLTLSAKSLTFSERAIDARGASTTATCNSTVWNDELKNISALNGTGDTTAVDKSTLQSLGIANSGPLGSVLHYEAYLVVPTSAWLTTDLNPTGNMAAFQTAPGQPLVPTGGALTAGQTASVKFASVANVNGVGGYPLLNQGTYHGRRPDPRPR